MATEIIEIEAKSNIKEVTKDVDKLGKSVKDTAGEAKKLKPATEAGASGFKKVGIAVRALGVAIKAIGIGLLISGFMALKEAFMRNQKAADFLKTSMTTISVTFNEVVDVIISMVEWVQKNSDQFEPYTKVMKAFVTLALNPFKLAIQTTEVAIRSFVDGFMRFRRLFGADLNEEIDSNMRVIKSLQVTIEETGTGILDAASDIVNNFGDANDIMKKFWGELDHQIRTIDLKKNWELADSLTEIEKAAAKAAITFAELNALYLKDAEVQRQIRDDISKTFAERIEANDELSRILKEQESLQRQQIQTQIDAAQATFESNKTEANSNAIREEKLKLLELEETLTGQASEQKTNRVALEKELLEVQRTLAEESLSNIDRELVELKNAYDEKLDMARKAGVDTVAITKEYERQKAAIVQEGVNEQLGAWSSLAGALSGLAGDNKELAIAQAIIDTYAGATKAFAQEGVLGFVSGAAIIVAGLANIKKIMETDVPGGGGGSMPSMVTPEPPSPQMMSGAFTLGGGADPEPARAYVVSDDITNNQNKLAIIRRRATI